MAQWKIWIGDLDQRDHEIVVPAEVRRWDDGDDPDTDPAKQRWDITQDIGAGEVKGMSVNETKAYVGTKVGLVGTSIKDYWDLWQLIRDQGGRYLPNWP